MNSRRPRPVRFQAATQEIETVRQAPVFQRFGEVQAAWLSLQERQVMEGIVMHLLLRPVAGMLRDKLIVDHQSNILQAANRDHFLMSILRTE